MGTSGRGTIIPKERAFSPGPGSSNIGSSLNKKGFVFSKGSKDIRFDTKTPGPGNYTDTAAVGNAGKSQVSRGGAFSKH